MRAATFFPLSFLALISFTLYSCAWKLHSPLTFKLDISRAVAARNPDIANFDLYLIAFRGQVPNTLSGADVGNRLPSCLGWSGLVMAGDINAAKAGFSPTLPIGIYTVQFYGVKGTGSTLAQMFGNLPTPEVYPLADAITVDTSSSGSKSVTATYSGSTGNLVPGCAPNLYTLDVQAIYQGKSGVDSSPTVYFEVPLTNPPKDATGGLMALLPGSAGIQYATPGPGPALYHVGLDYFLDAGNGATTPNIDIEVAFSATHGTASFGNSCSNGVQNFAQNLSFAIYNAYLGVWQNMALTPNSSGGVAKAAALYRSYLIFNGSYVISIISPDTAQSDHCAFISIGAISFRAAPAGES